MLAHVDGDVSVDHLHSNLLPGLEQAHAGRVAGVEVGLAGLDAASALQKGLLVHHHLVAGEIGEVDVVDLASPASWCQEPPLVVTSELP